jgi:predicted nucleotide-binding protein
MAPDHNQAPAVNPEKGIALLEKQIADANEIFPPSVRQGSIKLRSWKDRTTTCIEQIFGEDHRNARNFRNAFPTAQDSILFQSVREFHPALHDLIARLNGFIHELQTTIYLHEPSGSSSSNIMNKYSNKVFIVHGHNHPLKHELAHSLQNAGVDVTILHEQPNKGMTLIEKFAAHAQDVGFAVVLLTADDTGAEKPKEMPLLTPMLKPRARQNVVFELGFFIGLLRRERVCALYERGVEWPSDLNGITYVEYDSAGRWIHQVAKEIHAAGIPVDFSKLP